MGRFYQNYFNLTIIYVILTLGAITMVFPFLWMISTAFKPPSEVEAYPPYWIPKTPTIANFTEVLNRAPIHIYLLNTILVSTCVTLLVLFFCSLSGYVFAKLELPGKNILFLLILGKLMVPFQVTVIPLYLLINKLGLGDSLIALILPFMIGAFGIFFMRQFIISIPNELIDAARIDGCGEFGIYWRIILPSIRSALLTLAIITFMDSWGQYFWPLIVIRSPSKMTIELGLAFFTNQYFTDYGPMMAGAFISLVPVILVFIALQNRMIESITHTGLKG
jgi:multiple sugar transport system permease protein